MKKDSGDYLIPRVSVTFEEMFPTMEDVQIQWTERGRGSDDKTHRVTKQHYGNGKVSCSNPLCVNGGIDTTSYLREMARDQRTDAEYHRTCGGNERVGRRSRGECCNTFSLSVHIDYKVPTHSDTPE